MAQAKVYRPQRDWRGDGDMGDPIATLDEVIVGGPVPQNVDPRRFPGLVSTEGMIGVPAGSDVRKGDRLVVGGVTYAVSGPPQWNHVSTLTGTAPRYTWFECTASH